MPTASAARRASRTPARGAMGARPRATRPRVRWDRLGRIAMLGVMVALVYLYLSAGLSLLSSWQESRRADGQLASLERQHHFLQAQGASLKSPGTVEAEARLLGMAYPGERTYIVQGLPKD